MTNDAAPAADAAATLTVVFRENGAFGFTFEGAPAHAVVVNALELIKAQLIGQQLQAMAQAAALAQQKRIVAATGPLPNLRT